MLNYQAVQTLKIQEILGQELKYVSPSTKRERVGRVVQMSQTHCWLRRNSYRGDEYVPWGNVIELLGEVRG